MGMPFNADEVYEMAEQIERNGAKFYRAAAKKYPDVSKMLLDLAKWEDEHEKTFAAMRAELSGTEEAPSVFDPDNQAQMYLRVMADEHVFDTKTDPVKQLDGLATTEKVIKYAISMEKDSIVFYTGLKESTPRKAGKDKVEAIIKQELGHISILRQKLDEL